MVSKDKPRRLANARARTETRAASLSFLSIGALDPFQTLAVDSSRLQTLLGDCKLLLIVENCLRKASLQLMVQTKQGRLLSQSSVLRKSSHSRIVARFSELV